MSSNLIFSYETLVHAISGVCVSMKFLILKIDFLSTILIDVAYERLSEGRIIEVNFVNYFNRLGYIENGLVSKSIHPNNCL